MVELCEESCDARQMATPDAQEDAEAVAGHLIRWHWNWELGEENPLLAIVPLSSLPRKPYWTTRAA